MSLLASAAASLALAAQPAPPATEAPQLSLEQATGLRCGVAFALVAQGQQAGDPAALAYPAMDPRDALSRGVERVLLASEPWEFDEAQRDELAAARVFEDVPIVLCDGRDFCWHGVRMADGLGRALSALRR